jgi:hypothetical protein
MNFTSDESRMILAGLESIRSAMGHALKRAADAGNFRAAVAFGEIVIELDKGAFGELQKRIPPPEVCALNARKVNP